MCKGESEGVVHGFINLMTFKFVYFVEMNWLQKYREDYSATIKIGMPIVLGQLGIVVVGLVDNIMVGHFSTSDLAAASFVNSVFNSPILFGMGFSYGLTPLVGQFFGRGDKFRVGGLLRNSLLANFMIGLFLSVVMGIMYLNVHRMGQPEELLPLIRPYFLLQLTSLVFVMMFNSFKQFADGITDTKTSMWIMLSANLLNIIGNSQVMEDVQKTIEKISGTDANILLLGENGTGKDLIAHVICQHSPRAGAPFIPIDLGAIPETLFESELFGYEKGAFTDARKDKAGRLEAASGGTLFLDEIGNLSLPMQARLLTTLEKRQITRLGSTQARPIDIRLICATNADIHQMITEGTFRQDLLYRINTIEIPIPPLRERGRDILLLADHFLKIYSYKYKKEINGLNRETQQKLLNYKWPGNVRELQHAVERAVILATGRKLQPENFMLRPYRNNPETDPGTLNLKELEEKAIHKAMKISEGNISQAAGLLGITRFALYRKLEKYGLL